MHEDDTYYYNDRESPGLEAKPLEPRPAPEPTETRARSSPDRYSVPNGYGKTQSILTEGSRGRKKPHLGNPGEPILMHYFAPNNPELQRLKHCDCGEPCRCSSSPTDFTGPAPTNPQREMTVQNGPPQYALDSARDSPISRTASGAGIVRKAQDAFQSSKEVIVSRLKCVPSDASDEDDMDVSRRGSRSRSKALQERKRSSQLNENTLKDFTSSTKRPRTAESNLRSTAHLGGRASNGSEVSTGLSPILQPHMVKEQQFIDHENFSTYTLAPMSANSPLEAKSMASPSINVSLPPVGPIMREGTRSRAASYSSSSTANGSSLLPPPIRFMRQQTSSSSSDRTPMPPNPGPTSSSRYFANGPALERRAPRSRPPPGLHKYGSSTTSMGSVASVPGLSATESTSPEGFTPSTVATPGSNHGVSSDQAPDGEISPPSMPANYLHVTHPIAGFKCKFDGCDAPPFPTPYTLSSHEKKHSQERPYFCSEPGCKRSEGGLDGMGGSGFKRKNEMVRHGLVHKPPGYACPWCVDAQKHYPRPDNLLRHARYQHKDKDPSDPELRDILTRRIGLAQTRGRKKRA